MDVSQIVAQVLEVSGLTQAQLGKKIGVSQGTISKWINEGHSPNLDQWTRFLEFSKRHSAKTRAVVAASSETNEVRVMGRIGGGAEILPEFEQVPPEGLETIELPFDVAPNVVAFRVQGDSMLPAYRDGDAVLVANGTPKDPRDFIGKEAAVRTADGRRFIKEIEEGSRRGLFTLRSHNASPIKDIKIEWVGEILMTVKASQVRNVAMSKQSERRK